MDANNPLDLVGGRFVTHVEDRETTDDRGEVIHPVGSVFHVIGLLNQHHQLVPCDSPDIAAYMVSWENAIVADTGKSVPATGCWTIWTAEQIVRDATPLRNVNAEQIENNRCAAGTAYETLAAFARTTDHVLPPAYARAAEADADELANTLIDLLANLRHFCHAHGLDYDATDRQAAAYFEQEIDFIAPAGDQQ